MATTDFVFFAQTTRPFTQTELNLIEYVSIEFGWEIGAVVAWVLERR